MQLMQLVQCCPNPATLIAAVQASPELANWSVRFLVAFLQRSGVILPNVNASGLNLSHDAGGADLPGKMWNILELPDEKKKRPLVCPADLYETAAESHIPSDSSLFVFRAAAAWLSVIAVYLNHSLSLFLSVL